MNATKFSIYLDKSTGMVGIVSTALINRPDGKVILLVDIQPEPIYHYTSKADLLLLGWIHSSNNIQAFQRCPRTFHELSIEARTSLGFLPKQQTTEFYASRGIRKAGDPI